MKPASILSALTLTRPLEPLAVSDVSQQLIHKSARGTLWVAGSQVAKFLVQFVSQLVLARLLLPDDFGLVAMIIPIIAFIQIFNDIGLGQILILRDKLEHDFVSALFWLNMGLGIGIGLLISALAPVIAWIYAEPRLVPLVIASGLAVPFGSLSAHPNSLLIRQMRYGASSAIGVISTIVAFVITAYAAWKGWGYWSLIAGQYVASIVSCLLAWYASGWLPSAPRIDRSTLRELKFGGGITGANLANYLTTAGDNAIISVYYGSTMLGLYDRSYRLVVQPIGQLLAPISTTAAPLLARMRGDQQKYNEIYMAMAQAAIVLTAPGMLACAIFPEQVLLFLLGERWVAAAPVFMWISVGGLISAFYSSLMWLFLSQERIGEMMRVTLITSVVNVAAFAIGAQFSLEAVAAGGALSFLFVNLPLMLIVALRGQLVERAELFKLIMFEYGMIGAAAAALLFMRSSVVLSSFLTIFLAGAISYGLLVGANALAPSSRSRFVRVLRTVRRKH